MRKLFLWAVLFGIVPFIASAQFFPFQPAPHSSSSVGTNSLFVSVWQQGKQYENTTLANAGGYISAVFVNSNTYILDPTTALCASSASGSGPTGTGALITDGTCKWNWSAAGQTIKMPPNLIAGTKVETIAGGGGGDNGGSTNTCTDFVTPCGGGGGGGAYSIVSSPTLVAGSTYAYNAGTGGAGGVADGSISVGHFGTNGTSSWFNGASCGAAVVCSLPGAASTISGPGAGGAGSGGVGTQTAGGAGGKLFTCCSVGAGGGGAAGPKGAGQAGGDANSTGSSGGPLGAGGGGGGGGTAGGLPNNSTFVGGVGGANWQSTGAGVAGTVAGFTTSFPATENPIAQGSPAKWINGGSAGSTCVAAPGGGPGGSTQCWGNIQSNGSMALGIGNHDPTIFGDATAAVTSQVGTWTGTDQMITASVVIPGGQPSTCCQEVELRLNVVISAASIVGYELNCSVDSSSGYTTMVRWNGPNANPSDSNNGYTSMAGGAAIVCAAGDQLTLANIGGTIYAVVNRSGTAITTISASDGSPFSGGSPGFGFYNSTSSASYTGFGETNVQIPTPATNGAGGGGGGGASPRPGAAVAGNGSCGYEFDNGTGGNSLYGAGGGGGGSAGYDTGAAFPAGAFSSVGFQSIPGKGLCGSGGGEGGNASDTTGGQVTGGAGGNGFIAITYTHS